MADATTQYLILALVVSGLLNIVIAGVSFGLGIGRRVFKRIKQRWLYKRGKHVNVIMIRNTGVSDEHFIKKESDGSFLFENKMYVINRKAQIIFDGIPTQIMIEGTSEAIHPLEGLDASDLRTIDLKSIDTSNKISTAEVEKIIMNNAINDLVAALKKYFPLVLIFAVILVGFIAVSVYFNWQIFDVLVQGGTGQVIPEGTNI